MSFPMDWIAEVECVENMHEIESIIGSEKIFKDVDTYCSGQYVHASFNTAEFNDYSSVLEVFRKLSGRSDVLVATVYCNDLDTWDPPECYEFINSKAIHYQAEVVYRRLG